MMHKFKNLTTVYQDIHTCHICPNMNTHKSLRDIDAVNLSSDVFVISQALAKGQLRLSGVNFFNEKGEAGNTGNNLEKFINKFNRTIFPPVDITLPNFFMINKCNPNYLSVYNSEIVQCFPGIKNKNDRVPSQEEAVQCTKKLFLLNEIRIIKPKLILLMGRLSYTTFFSTFLNKKICTPLSKYLEEIDTKNDMFYMDNLSIPVIPIQHASGANPNFYSMLINTLLIDKIKSILM